MILQGLLDTDLYKLTMQQAILAYKPGVQVEYRFSNRRREGKFTPSFGRELKQAIEAMEALKVSDKEISWLGRTCPFLTPQYLEYLRNYQFDPTEVECEIVENELNLSIKGSWERTILWEVPLMALISELYFRSDPHELSYHRTNTQEKGRRLAASPSNFTYADFGTRRRRSFRVQEIVVEELRKQDRFVGTSNPYLAYKYDVRPIGTMAHEWIMGISALESLRYANRYALTKWNEIYKGRLGIALTDTFGSDAFFNDFDNVLARLFDGVRHDSGDPIKFGHRAIEHYRSLNIDPCHKTIVFSDGLNIDKTLQIADYFDKTIKMSFGIGTHLTNDFPGSPALNMVIKLRSVNNIPVVKISDEPGKEIGDDDARRVARWTFFQTPLDIR